MKKFLASILALTLSSANAGGVYAVYEYPENHKPLLDVKWMAGNTLAETFDHLSEGVHVNETYLVRYEQDGISVENDQSGWGEVAPYVLGYDADINGVCLFGHDGMPVVNGAKHNQEAWFEVTDYVWNDWFFTEPKVLEYGDLNFYASTPGYCEPQQLEHILLLEVRGNDEPSVHYTFYKVIK